MPKSSRRSLVKAGAAAMLLGAAPGALADEPPPQKTDPNQLPNGDFTVIKARKIVVSNPKGGPQIELSCEDEGTAHIRIVVGDRPMITLKVNPAENIIEM